MTLLIAPAEVPHRPEGRIDRWQPTRAGIVNLWRYWDETFTFHHGRLLLRGPNGSGKSMALELLLPFLLDGDASPTKLTSAAKSRGGLYERVMTGTTDSTRTGFAWIEFRQADDTFTVGVRIRASASTRSVTRSLFTTTQTIGADLHLLDEGRVPLARKALDEAIGEHGRITDSAAEHRDAVRAALYPEFSADRYDALVNALLALRKEKLSQHLDLDKLDEVMSEALPAIDDHEIAAVAEGFERLDRRRDELALLERDVDEIESLVKRQREYARAVVASVADAVRKAESTRDGIVRRQRIAADELAEVVQAIETLDAEDRSARDRLRDVGGELDGIRSSELYKESAQLAQLRHDRDQRVDERDRLAEDLEHRRAELVEAEELVASAEEEVATASHNELAAHRELLEAAEIAGAGATIAEALDADEPQDGPHDGTALIGAWVRERRAGISEIRGLVREHARAVERRIEAEQRLETQRQRVDELVAEQRRAAEALVAARTAFVDDVRTWAEQSTSLSDEWRTLVIDALEDPERAPDAVSVAVADVRSRHATGVALARSDLEVRRAAVVTERDEHIADRAELEQGRLPIVDPPAWRSKRSEVRAGAPFWQLVDVADGTGDAVVDQVEAALVATGLADAWVSPSGAFELPDDVADIFLTTFDGAGSVDDRLGTLATVLTPLADVDTNSGVDPSIVGRILASIPLQDTAGDAVDQPVVIGTDGTFRFGSAAGRGATTPGVLFGAVARERHRRAELERLADLIADCEHQIRGIDAEETQLDGRIAVFDADVEALPSRGPADDAASTLAGAEVRFGEADANRRAGEESVRVAETGVRDAQRALATRASALGMPADDSALDAYGDAVDSVEQAAGTWGRRSQERATATKQLDVVRRAFERAERAAGDLAARWQSADDTAAQLAAKVQSIEATIGQDLGAMLARLAELESTERTLIETREAISTRRPELDRRHGTVDAELRNANQDLANAEDGRTRAQAQLVDLYAGPLPTDAGIDPPAEPLDGVTLVLGQARVVAVELDGVRFDAEIIDRLSLQVERRLHDTRAAVGIRVDLDRHAVDRGWYVLRGSTGGIRRGLVDLSAHLHHQLTEARAELHADEAALFERTLAGSVRHALADRIRGANALVSAINEQLSAVQTAAAGVAVRLRWDVDEDQPDAVRTARTLLLRDPADLTDTERKALQDFVRARVDQARAELEQHAPWEARLRESLDYRPWHRFSLQVSHRDWEGFKPATSRLLQRLSTGERSVALHLPMLASIAAHYTGNSGTPGDGPRLILLDELFAGVDAANRAQLFGTFQAWDLDAVFTSDHEWCQYASLDGIAIHHLQGGLDDEPVTSTRFTWDGRERRIDDGQG